MSPRAGGRMMPGWLVMGTLVAAVAGCAPVAKPPASATPPPRATSPASAPGSSAPKSSSASARSDSLPSPDAERLLATIPEPLSPSQQVAPDSTKPRSVPAPEAGYDTLRVQPQGGEVSSVPVPAPTPVVAAPVVTFAPTESTLHTAPVASAPATTAPAAPDTVSRASGAAASSGAAPPVSGPCWRVQVAAPATRAEAESRLETAQSLMVVKMTIVPEKGLFKVRTSDCMTRDAADALKRRALDTGFAGSFLVDTAATPKPSSPAPKKPASGAHR